MIYSKEARIELKKTTLFKQSNKHWNELNLNHGFVVGYLMSLLDKSKAKTFYEWENYYFDSGAVRQKEILKIQDDDIKESLFSFNRNIPKIYYKYNTEYGRTIKDLEHIALKLDKVINVGLELALNYVYIRIIDETWVGHERELSTFLGLKKYLSLYSLNIEKTPPEIDVAYGVDFEIKKNNKLIAGLQLKSTNYLENKYKLSEIIHITEKKNNLYKERFNAPVYFIYMDTKGAIMNLNDIYYHIVKKNNTPS